jgi:four helix bundle protein
MKKGNDNIIVKMTFDFALSIMNYCPELDEHRKWTISNQLLDSGTAIGPNVREAQNAESKADFIHKFKIAGKETEETCYWLELCNVAKGYPRCEELIPVSKDILKIINKIIATSKGGSSIG